MTTKDKPKYTLERYITDKTLRKKFYLYTCRLGGNHMWSLDVPTGVKNHDVYEWYGLDTSYCFPKEKAGERISLVWECISCHKIHLTNPKICKKCLRAINPLSKKLEKYVVIYKTLKCHCHEE